MEKSVFHKKRIFIQMFLFLSICLLTMLRWSTIPNKNKYTLEAHFIKNLNKHISHLYIDKSCTHKLHQKNGHIIDPHTNSVFELQGVLSYNTAIYSHSDSPDELTLLSLINNEIWIFDWDRYYINLYPNDILKIHEKTFLKSNDLITMRPLISTYPVSRFAFSIPKNTLSQSLMSIKKFVSYHQEHTYIVSHFSKKRTDKSVTVCSCYIEFEDLQSITIPGIGRCEIVAIIGDKECIIKSDNKMHIALLDFHHVYLSEEYSNISQDNYNTFIERNLFGF